ncbi:hypothetical protein BGZ76_001035 [Entomortierella beljakovae]|nr:hypothetical protein BGZ76_001035 [Entomortierella beljakovae]
MRHSCWRGLSILTVILSLVQQLNAQQGPGPLQSSQTISILGDELYLHGGSQTDTFLETNCTADLWRLRLGRTTAWNLSNATWELVPIREDISEHPPVSGIGLKALSIPGNYTISTDNGTSTSTQSISPYMIEFGRAGCLDNDDQDETKPWIGFNIYNPIMNTWESIDFVNPITDIGINTTATLATGNWLSPTVAVDNVNFAWYIILQSNAPLRQVILRKDLSALTSFMSPLDLTESRSTNFPTELLYEDWEVKSILNENAPFVGKGVATFVKDKIVIISGTANSFTSGDIQQAELRGCDHAYVYTTTKNIWERQTLTVALNGQIPDTREKAAFLADLWILDTETWTWTRGPDGPGPRADHTLLQYYEYIIGVSGFNVGRNLPIDNVLPLMVYNTNSTNWTDIIRATSYDDISYVSDITRIAIIIATVVVGIGLLVLGLSTHLLRKWNQRNYMKVTDDLELDTQRKSSKTIPSILKKNRSTGRGGVHLTAIQNAKGLQSEVIFEDVEGEYENNYEDEEVNSYDDERGSDDGHLSGQRVSLLSRSQANPTSRPPRRVRIAERTENVEEGDEYDGDRDSDADTEENQVTVHIPPNIARREE